MTSRTQRSRSTSGPNFDRIAPIYRWAEYLALGPLLQRTRTQFLTDLLDRRHALILGDGDGRFLAELLRLSPSVQALALDISGSMLHHLRMRCLRRAPSSSFRLRTLQTSTLGFTPSNETDLVVTHFLLDCFTQPDVDALAERFATHLPPGALWLLSDFGVPRRKWQRPFAALYVRALYLVFRLATGLRITHLPNPQRSLQMAGFQLRRRSTRLGGLLYTELWELPLTVPETAALRPEKGSIPFAEAMNPTFHPDFRSGAGGDLRRQALDSDPLPDPEPSVPSLDKPDPGVFHHDPAIPAPPFIPLESERV